jgi:hypothetical protein
MEHPLPMMIPQPFTECVHRIGMVKNNFIAAFIGTAKAKPIPPHIQPQKSNARVTASGFNRNRGRESSGTYYSQCVGLAGISVRLLHKIGGRNSEQERHRQQQ